MIWIGLDFPDGMLCEWRLRLGVSWQRYFAESDDLLRDEQRPQTIIAVRGLRIGGEDFAVMAGPCSVETEPELMATGEHLRRCGVRILRGGAFKPRTSPYSFQGHGLAGLKMLERVGRACDLAIVTEAMSEDAVEMVAEYADIVQIGARNMENTTLLRAAARCGRPILLKRGLVATLAELLRAAQVVVNEGNPQVMLCERGIRTFETAMRNTLDAGGIALLKEATHLPVIADPSHAAGDRRLVPALARIAVAAGADGLLVETHPRPERAWSDGEQSLDFAGFAGMMRELEPYVSLRRRAVTQTMQATQMEAVG